jgi:hypothetical protein
VSNSTPMLHGGVATLFVRPHSGISFCNDTYGACKRPGVLPAAVFCQVSLNELANTLVGIQDYKLAKDVVTAASSGLSDLSPRFVGPCSTVHPVILSFFSGSFALSACGRRLSRYLVSWGGNAHPVKLGCFA